MATTDGDRIPLMLIHGAWLSARSWDRCAAAIDGWLDGVLEAAPAQNGGRRSD